MLNIISQSVLLKQTRGPKKVVENLIKGLDLIGYPYVINKALDATDRLWIQDDINALGRISELPERVKVIVGPNLFVNPEHIPSDIDLKKTIYLQPSQNVEKIWKKRGYDKSPIALWPAGVDTETFAPFSEKKEHVLVYVKNREEQDIQKIFTILKEKHIVYTVIRYGSYKEAEYKEALAKTKYIIWIGGSESQGLALEEALSCNIPILVVDEGKVEYETELTSAPYFDNMCGIKIKDFVALSSSVEKMEKEWQQFQPRQFIIQNLSLEKQARDFVELYESYFGISVEKGMLEKIKNDKDWINNKPYFKVYIQFKEFIKKHIL